MLPVGFSLSSFSRMRQPFGGTIWRNAEQGGVADAIQDVPRNFFHDAPMMAR